MGFKPKLFNPGPAIWLSLSLIRVPKLFISLLLWPLLIGIALAATQVVITASFVQLLNEDTNDFSERINRPDPQEEWMRGQLFGRTQPFPSLELCRWKFDNGREIPASPNCEIGPLEVAIQVENPETYDSSKYEKFFKGTIPKLHICKSCKAEVIVSIANSQQKENISNIYSLKSLGIFVLTESQNDKEINDQFIQAKTLIEDFQSVTGDLNLNLPGNEMPINITNAAIIMILVLNIAFLIIITLWLSLVGHRKVLQYFSKNDALLPLVAACGKSNFYSAIWIITLLRVSCFLFASVPSTYLIYVREIPKETLNRLTGDSSNFLLWLAGIISSLGVMTVIASIAELKHRHSYVSFLYKYVPLFCTILGTLIWTTTLFFDGPLSNSIQFAVSSLPLIGISPLVLAPVIHCNQTALLLHTIFASIIAVSVFRLNAKWFAAHLEEI